MKLEEGVDLTTLMDDAIQPLAPLRLIKVECLGDNEQNLVSVCLGSGKQPELTQWNKFIPTVLGARLEPGPSGLEQNKELHLRMLRLGAPVLYKVSPLPLALCLH